MPKRLMERELSTRVGNGLLAPMLFTVVRSFSRFPSIYWIGHRHDQEGGENGKNGKFFTFLKMTNILSGGGEA